MLIQYKNVKILVAFSGGGGCCCHDIYVHMEPESMGANCG